MMPVKIFLCFCTLFSALSFAAESSADKTTVIKRQAGTIENKDCEKTKTCDLESVSFAVEDFAAGPYFWTKFIAGYETKTVDDLENYLFVQFMRGCVYRTAEDITTGIIETRFDIVRRLFGKHQLFVHKDWDIDSGGVKDGDPAYYTNLPDAREVIRGLSEQEKSYSPPRSLRHFFYMWNETEPNAKKGRPGVGELSTDLSEKKSTNFYGLERPKKPRLWVDDEPEGTSLFTESEQMLLAKNISLEFRMCLYRTGDVPIENIAGMTLANPIACIPWRSSFVFNHVLKQFESPEGISQACTAAPDPKTYDLGQGYPVVPYFKP